MTTIDFYNQNAERFYRDTVDIDMTALYEPFLTLLPTNAHILDAGCGSGRDSLYFLQNNYQVTALDASEELSNLATDLIKQPVLNIKFQELNFENQFEGVWASASLLHISRDEISDVLKRITTALKPKGVLYVSFKHGDKEYVKNGRYFNCYDKDSFTELVENSINLKLLKTWYSNDIRLNRNDEIWLNALLISTEIYKTN